MPNQCLAEWNDQSDKKLRLGSMKLRQTVSLPSYAAADFIKCALVSMHASGNALKLKQPRMTLKMR